MFVVAISFLVHAFESSPLLCEVMLFHIGHRPFLARLKEVEAQYYKMYSLDSKPLQDRDVAISPLMDRVVLTHKREGGVPEYDLHVYNLASDPPQLISTIARLPGPIHPKPRFSPASNWLITSDGLFNILVWNVETGQIIHRFHHAGTVSSTFTKDQTYFVSGNRDGKIRIFNVEKEGHSEASESELKKQGRGTEWHHADVGYITTAQTDATSRRLHHIIASLSYTSGQVLMHNQWGQAFPFLKYQGPATAMAFSRRGNLLGIATKHGQFQILATVTGQLLFETDQLRKYEFELESEIGREGFTGNIHTLAFKDFEPKLVGVDSLTKAAVVWNYQMGSVQYFPVK